MPKLLAYVHTPPRLFTDQFSTWLKTQPKWLHPFLYILKKLVHRRWLSSIRQMDLIIANSKNIQTRVRRYLDLEITQVLFPAVKTSRFSYLGQGYLAPQSFSYQYLEGTWHKTKITEPESEYNLNCANLVGRNYFLSAARLENLKRIPLLIETFAQLPEQFLVICSSGPLSTWVLEQIQTRRLSNIAFEGRVSEQRLKTLLGRCLAGIYIPVDEDAGITPCEIMAAGKPVVGVKEGGLLETVKQAETGWLIETKNEQGEYLPDSQIIKNLLQVLEKIDLQQALQMQAACRKQAENFDEIQFFSRLNQILVELIQT